MHRSLHVVECAIMTVVKSVRSTCLSSAVVRVGTYTFALKPVGDSELGVEKEVMWGYQRIDIGRDGRTGGDADI